MKSKILFDVNSINKENIKEYLSTVYELGRLNNDKPFYEICEFVEVSPTEITESLSKQKEYENNLNVIETYIQEEL